MKRMVGSVIIAVCVLVTAVPDAGAQHEGHTQPKPEQKPAPEGAVDHSQHQKPGSDLPPFIPTITEADRMAAFPDVEGHSVHDRAMNYFVLFDQLEWQSAEGGAGANLDSKGWLGWDRDRFWFRAEGDAENGRIGEAEAHVFYGRQFARWWDVIAGMRQDFRPGPSRTWAAVGVQGLAPYWFEVELTAYVGGEGRTHFRGEVEYELLLTNRLVLQPLAELEVFGKSDPERGIGAGLSAADAGVRLRYEFRREFAPYVGVVWKNKFGRTADLAEAAGEDTGGVRFVTGVRLWF